MRRRIAVILAMLLLLTGCTKKQLQQFQLTYLDVFDTVMTLRGYETDSDSFQKRAETVHTQLVRCHKLFDIYNSYESMNNLKTVNDNAGIAPVVVDRAIIELLKDCRTYYELSGGKMNAAMGSVLRLWHEQRENGIENPENAKLPDMDALEAAAAHCSFDTVIIDEEAGTVFITDPEQRLDVGAIAKGWSAQLVSSSLPEGYLLDLGCNIVATGAKPDGSLWKIGVQNPNPDGSYLCILGLDNGCTVTSGDYQRYYEVDGKIYHHIIDIQTLFPAAYWRSVTILAEDSGMADALSTALFVMDYESGLELLRKAGCEAMWMDASGKKLYSPGFQSAIQK